MVAMQALLPCSRVPPRCLARKNRLVVLLARTTSLSCSRQLTRFAFVTSCLPYKWGIHLAGQHHHSPDVRRRIHPQCWAETLWSFADWSKEKTVCHPHVVHISCLNVFCISCGTDPLVHHGRHFGRTVHVFCTISALLNNGILRMGELAEQPAGAFTHEYVLSSSLRKHTR